MKSKWLIVGVIFLLTGCYNYRELNDLAITTALGIDKEGDEYVVTAQIINTQKSVSNEDSTNPKVYIYEGRDKTLQEAIRKVVLASPKRLYTYHMQVMVIGEEVAKEGISEILDFIFRDNETRLQFYALVSHKVSSKDVLKTLTQLDTVGSASIKKSLMANNQFYGTTSLITFEDVIDDYLNPNIEVIIPSITVIGSLKDADKLENVEESEALAYLKLDNMAVFKDDKLLGYLNDEESIAINFINDNIENTLITYACEKDKYVTAEIIDAKTDVSVVKNKLEVNVKIRGDGNINEVHCDLNLENAKTIKKIQNNVNKKIKEMINKTFSNISSKYNSDVFGFKDLYYKTNNRFYKKINKDWYNNYFKKVKLKVDSNIVLVEKGSTLREINNEKK